MADEILTTGSTVTERVQISAGGTYTLQDGATYTCPFYDGNGGAVEVQEGGIVSGNNVTFAGNTATAGGAIYNHGGTTMLTGEAKFIGNITDGDGGAIYNGDNSSISFAGGTFAGNVAAWQGGAINNYQATVTITDDVLFSGNSVLSGSAYGGAICNAAGGTINFSCTIDLAMDSDTWVNQGTSASQKTTVNWDLSQLANAVEPIVCIKHFERYSNANEFVKQTITVAAAPEAGQYVIATGVLTDLANKDTFTVKTADDATGVQIKVGDSNVKYGDTLYYSLANVDNAQLVLTVTDTSKRIVVPSSATPSPYALVTGGTYTCPAYSGNGGAVRVGDGGTITGSNVTFAGNSATGNGGAICNLGTVNFTGASVTFTGNTVTGGTSLGGAIYNNQGNIKFSGTIDLATASDTWVNSGSISIHGAASFATVRWDLTGGHGQYASIRNFERYSNLTTTVLGEEQLLVGQRILVNADQELGDYVIATGDLSNVTGKDGFNLMIDGMMFSDEIKINTLGYHYGNRYYSLTNVDNAQLVLTVADHYEVTKSKSLGGIDTTLAGGTYTRMVLGGELQSGSYNYEGSYTITVTDGTFNSDVAGGDASNGTVVRTGDVTVNVSGGVFAKTLSAGSYYASTTSVYGTAVILGNLTLNISGGTFMGRVYGGNGAMTDTLGVRTALQGSTNITIDAFNAIYFGECIAAGNRGHGIVLGSTNVTVKGDGDNLKFAKDSVLFGGCSGDYYNVVGGKRTSANTQVVNPTTWEAGDRKLTFDGFTHDFDAEIRMFSEITFRNYTDLNFADAELDLKEIGIWNFDCTSTASNLTKNEFTGDTINVDTTDWTSEWTLLSGDAAAFADLGSATSVTLGGNAAEWKGSMWTDGTYTLSVQNNTKLVISKIA